MDNSVFLDEERNLIDNLNRIDLLISKINQKIDSYNYDAENTLDEKKKEELLEKKYDRVLEVNKLKELKKCPYFGHLVLECDNELLEIFVGEKTIHLDGEFIIYDYRNPLCILFYANQTSFKYNGNNYKLRLKRKVIIEDENLIECFEDTELFENKVFENRSSNYLKTITSEQNMINRFDKNKNIFIYGGTGTGKSTTLLYRISFLNYNYPGVDISNYLYITNNKNKYKELRKDIDLDNIATMSISEYYLSCLYKLFNNKELDSITVNIDGKLNKDIINSELEGKTLNLIYDKYLSDVEDDIERFKDEFNLKVKEFNNYTIYDKYDTLEEIINVKLNDELDKINILKNNVSGWLSSIYAELEDNISGSNENTDYYSFDNTNRKDSIISFLLDIDNEIENKIINYTNIDKSVLTDYLKLSDYLLKNINTVVNTLKRNNIAISFDEYNFQTIISEFNKYKDSTIKLINEYKTELENITNDIENFKMKVIRNNSYNELVDKKEELEGLIKTLEYTLFILIDIENKYILKFEDNYNEILKLEDKLDKGYINLLEYKKYFDKVKEFIFVIYKYENYIEVDNLISDKMLSIINLFKARFNKKVRYYNFIYVEMFNCICNDINFDNIKKYNEYLIDISYRKSNNYLLDTFISSSKVVYCRNSFELDNLNIYRLLYITLVTGYYKTLSSRFDYIFIDDIDNYSLLEVGLIKNTSMNAYFNITSRDLSYLKNINKIIDGKIYSLNINLRNTASLVKYCNNKFNLKVKGSNNIGNVIRELDFINYKDTLDLIRSYCDIVLIGEDKYLDYFKNNNVNCLSINDELDEYSNVVLLEDSSWDDNLKYYLYTRTLGDLIIINTKNITENAIDLEII